MICPSARAAEQKHAARPRAGAQKMQNRASGIAASRRFWSHPDSMIRNKGMNR
jgi:hypothetical protein